MIFVQACGFQMWFLMWGLGECNISTIKILTLGGEKTFETSGNEWAAYCAYMF